MFKGRNEGGGGLQMLLRLLEDRRKLGHKLDASARTPAPTHARTPFLPTSSLDLPLILARSPGAQAAGGRVFSGAAEASFCCRLRVPGGARKAERANRSNQCSWSYSLPSGPQGESGRAL